MNLREIIESAKFDGPWRIPIDVLMAPSTQTGWSTRGVDAGAIGNGYLTAVGGQNSEVGWDLDLPAGTWEIFALFVSYNDSAIMTFSINGADVGTIDVYSASLTQNNFSSIGGIVVARRGKHRLLAKLATKNAASSNYYVRLQALSLRRTA